MNPDMKNRMIELMEDVSESRSNCFGTAFYVCGKEDIDEYIWFNDFNSLESYLSKKKFVEIKEPEVSSLVIQCLDTFPCHAGIILNLDPLLYFQRAGVAGEVLANYPLEIKNSIFSYHFYSH